MIENRLDFEDGVLLTELEWKKQGYKLITGAWKKAVKGEDGAERYDCNAVCRLKPAKTGELTENEWLKCGYVVREGAFGREMHYFSQSGIFIYTRDEVEKDEEKAKEILDQKRKARNKRQKELREARKQRKQELEELLDSRIEEMKELRSSFESKQNQFEKLTEKIRNKRHKIVEVAFDRYNSYDFVTDDNLDEYLVGEKIDIPGYDEATIIGTREGTLKYDLCYPCYFDFKYSYKKLDGTHVKLENYVTDEESKAFEEQRHEDYKRYDYLKEWCKEAEEKLWFGHY